MNLLELTLLPHVGPILLSGEQPGVPDPVSAAAALVTHVDELVWSAPSAASAAAWLLTTAHTASTVEDESDLPLGLARRRNGWVACFRGQDAKYSQVTASQCRPGVDRVREGHAAEWLRHALNAFDESHFIPTLRIMNLPAIDPRDTDVPAQHYGIRTTLVDWTFDPLVATFFGALGAAANERANVFWMSLDYSRGRGDDTFFPPPFVERMWIQRGVFRRHPCLQEVNWMIRQGLVPDLYLTRRYGTSSYPRIEFEVTPEDVAAVTKLQRHWLGDGTDPVEAVARWAVQAANKPPPEYYADAEYLAEHVEEVGLPPIPLPKHPIRENLTTIVDYLDSMAMQLYAGSLQYGLGPLYAFWASALNSLNVAWKVGSESSGEFRSVGDNKELPPKLANDLERYPELNGLIHAARSDARVRLLTSSSTITRAHWHAAGLDRPPSISFSKDEQTSTIETAKRASRTIARRLMQTG